MVLFGKAREIMALEVAAERSGSFNIALSCWQTPFYEQRPFWYDIYNGLTSIFNILCYHRILETFPNPMYSSEYFETLKYLRIWGGLAPLQDMFEITPRILRKNMTSIATEGLHFLRSINSIPQSEPLRAISATLLTHDEEELTRQFSQSKLSQEQLTELQRSTHFDRKELQQWYKGALLVWKS